MWPHAMKACGILHKKEYWTGAVLATHRDSMMVTVKSINNNNHYASDDAMAERKSGRNVENKKML